ALRLAATAAERAGSDAAGRAAVTRARLIVQQKVGGNLTAGVSKPFAEADRLLLTGRYRAAVEKLTEAYRAA
ncbi:hypothetical protein, partial [Streptomyces sp. NPDC002491]